MVSIIHRQRFFSLTLSFSHILSPSPRQALLHGQQAAKDKRGCCSHHALQQEAGRSQILSASSKVDNSTEENRLIVNEEAGLRELWPVLPSGHIQALSLWVSPASHCLCLTKTVSEKHDEACRWWSRLADICMLPVDLKGQCSNPFRWKKIRVFTERDKQMLQD